ncbi:DMT family transporter [Methylorubrum sp. SB2]|uniref:DMT family transporter n=1 Tax=Methylorubrum subtropicum TaxID=3138812 RepID=UPI00313E7E5D
MTSPIGFYLAAACAGVAFVVQQAANAKLRGALGSGLWAGFTNFAVGGIAVLVVIAILRESLPTLGAAGRAPWYAWTGGGLGALYIIGSVFLLPRIGAASLIALIIVGQMLASLAFDHFGLMGVPVHEANVFRILGAVLLIAGVALITLF